MKGKTKEYLMVETRETTDAMRAKRSAVETGERTGEGTGSVMGKH